MPLSTLESPVLVSDQGPECIERNGKTKALICALALFFADAHHANFGSDAHLPSASTATSATADQIHHQRDPESLTLEQNRQLLRVHSTTLLDALTFQELAQLSSIFMRTGESGYQEMFDVVGQNQEAWRSIRSIATIIKDDPKLLDVLEAEFRTILLQRSRGFSVDAFACAGYLVMLDEHKLSQRTVHLICHRVLER